MGESSREMLLRGGVIRNAWLTVGDPGLAEIVAASSAVDTVTLDLQHSEIDGSRTGDLLRAIENGGAEPMARLAGPDPASIGRLLDLGFVGLIMPTVSSTQAASAFVAATRYPPHGVRSHGPIRVKADSLEPVLWAMIETRAGLESAEEIAAVDGIDGLFIGPGDLGISLGIGGGQNRTEPEFLEAVETIKRSCGKAKCGLAIHSTDLNYTRQMFESGFNMVTVWVDAVTIASSLRTLEGFDWVG